jgi:hypothetical protein
MGFNQITSLMINLMKKGETQFSEAEQFSLMLAKKQEFQTKKWIFI